MNYRHATQSDLGEICSLIKAAIAEMERHSILASTKRARHSGEKGFSFLWKNALRTDF